MTDDDERRGAYLALADDLGRWARACRDGASDLCDPEIAAALERLAARCQEKAHSPTPKDR